MKRHAASLLACAMCAALGSPPASAGLVVWNSWSETTLRFPAFPGVVATATTTGLATVTTTSSSTPAVSTLSFQPMSLLSTLPLTGSPPAVRTALIVDLEQRPDLLGDDDVGVGNVAGALGGGVLSPAEIPHTGGVTLCLLVMPLPPCAAQLEVELGATSLGAPVGLGVGGLLTLTKGTGSFGYSVRGAPYTIGTVSMPNRTSNGGFEVVTARGFAHGPLSDTSSAGSVSGVVQLVTATRIHADLTSTDTVSDLSGAISRTLIHFPEPRVFTLFVSGAALVAWLGWQRTGRR